MLWNQFVYKLAAAVATLWTVSVLIFSAVEVLPQDPALAALGHESTPEERHLFRQRMHLDDPPIQRYVRWLGGMLRGDFGQSVISGRPVASMLAGRLARTAVLTVAAITVSLMGALPFAIAVARRPGRSVDLLTSAIALAVSAVPEYVIGICLLLVLAVAIHLLPVVSTGISEGQWEGYILPVLTLALVAGSYVYRLARVSLIETLHATYVRSAILRGFSPQRVMWRHVLPNAGIVLVNVVALNAIYLIGGVIVVENVFAYPGLGTLLVDAISTKDMPAIEGVAMVTSLFIITINLLADAIVVVLNPRLRT
jgi:peptide/nickel transport system permease protein